MTKLTKEQHVERLTTERGYERKSWGFRSGVRDGFEEEHGGLCDSSSWAGYDEGFLAGQEARLRS